MESVNLLQNSFTNVFDNYAFTANFSHKETYALASYMVCVFVYCEVP